MKDQPSTIKSQPLSVDRLRLWLLIAVVGVIASMASAASVFAQIVGTAQLHVERRGHTATLLQGGKVLIVGGDNQSGIISQAEIFDPAVQTSSLAASASIGRTDHTATRLADGRVLIIGGRDQNGALASTEIYDPSTASFAAGPSLTTVRSGHTATVLSDDRILVAGGDATGRAELYNPATQSFSLVSGNMIAARKFHSAILMSSGQVLIVGGIDAQNTMLDTAEVFDPASQSFYIPPTDMQTARAFATLKLLPDGKVQIIGGDAELSMEVFDPADGIFIAKALLPPNANLLGATLSTQSRAALFSPLVVQDPLLQSVMTPEQLALLDRADQSITELPSRNQALVAGGIDSAGQTLKSAKLVSSSSASITTDKTDYAPGQIVTISGSGFQPNEQVDIYFHEFPEEYPDVFFSVVANQQGNFVTAEFAPQEIDLGRIFTLTAIGQTSGFTAQTSFKDARPNTVTVSGQNPNPVPAGSSVTFTVTVGFNGNSTSCTVDLSIAGLPAGASFVSFSQNPVTGSGVSSVNSTLTLSSATSLSAGNHGFTVTAASRSGCQNHPISSNGNGTLVVAAAANTATTTTVNSSANPSAYGQSVSFTATVSPNSGSAAPTGTVQFKINGSNFGSPVTLSPSGINGIATSGSISTLTVAGSPHTIEAVYIPTGSFTTSTGTLSGGEVIEKATPTATLAVSNSPQTYNGSPQAGTVVISASSVPGAVANILTGGAATQTNAGTFAVTADFVPTDSANYNSLIGLSAGNFVIEKAGSTTTVSCPANVTYNGTAQTPCTASYSTTDGLGGPLTVNYANNTNAGTATANASYPGDANHKDSSDSKTFTIEKANSVTTVTCPASVVYNGMAQEPCTAKVTGVGLDQNLTVSYQNNVNAETATASASYPGDANHNGSSDTKYFTIEKAPSVTTVTFESGPYVYRGTPFTATAVVTGVGGLNQALAVVYTGDCTYVTSVNGCTATATFSGDANHIGSSDSKSITITTAFAYSGFYPPIGGSVEYANGGSYANPVRSFKLGSTIPVKFGATWLNGGAPLITGVHKLQAVKYSNATTIDGEIIDATPTDAATSGNQFRLTGTEWHFNLSTKGLTAGTWLLRVTLVDGSQYTVWITIKK